MSMFSRLPHATFHWGLQQTQVEARSDANILQSLHDRYNKWEKPEFNLYTQDNAAAPPNWKQDSKAQSRNALTGELPPSTLDS
jgi:hypothetical protein